MVDDTLPLAPQRLQAPMERQRGNAVFIALPLLYPVTYTLFHNPEVVTDLPYGRCRQQPHLPSHANSYA